MVQVGGARWPTLIITDPTTRSLLAMAPFGLSGKPPQRTGPGLRDTAEQLGVVVPAGDPATLATALQQVLYDDDLAAGCRDRIAAVAQHYTWEDGVGAAGQVLPAPAARAGPVTRHPRCSRPTGPG